MIEESIARRAAGRRRALIVIAGLGVVVYMGAALATDADRLLAALVRLGVVGTALILLMSLVNYLLRFHRWTLYIGELGHRIPTGRHLLFYLCGFAFTVSPAKAGEAVRSLYLREYGVGYSESIAALFVERLLDLLAMALLASLIVLEQQKYWPVLVAAVATTIGLLVVVGQPALPRGIARLAAGRRGRAAKGLSAIERLLKSSQQMLSPSLLFGGLAIGLVAWAAEGIGFDLICRGLDFDLAPTAAIGIYAIAALGGGAAFFMPGGIGGMEVVMTSLLVAHGAPFPIAVIATLLCRLATLWLAVVIGLIAAAILEMKTKKAVPVRLTP